MVLCGERATGLMQQRLRQAKLTLYMSERWWKSPLSMARLAHPRFALMALRLKRLAASRTFHYLPIGHYAAEDMKRWAALSNVLKCVPGIYTRAPVVRQRSLFVMVKEEGSRGSKLGYTPSI